MKPLPFEDPRRALPLYGAFEIKQTEHMKEHIQTTRRNSKPFMPRVLQHVSMKPVPRDDSRRALSFYEAEKRRNK